MIVIRALMVAAATLGMLSAGIGPQKESDAKMTLTLQAMSVANALTRLSTAAQLPLVASTQTANEVICLRFKDVPLCEALKRIAEAVDGTWRVEGSGYRLIRTSDQLRAEKTHEYQLDVERFRGEIQRAADGLDKYPAWSSAEAESLAASAESISKGTKGSLTDPKFMSQAYAIAQQTPMGRFEKQFASLLDPQELADLPLFYQVVWSSSPTAMQRPLSHDALDRIRQAIQAQKEWNEAADRHGLTDRSNAARGFWMEGGFDSSAGRQHPVGKVLLIGTRTGLGGNATFELVGYDASGSTLGQSSSSLSDTSVDATAFTNKKADSSPEADSVVSLGPDAVALVESFPRQNRGDGTLTQDLIARLTNPELNDPLSLTLSPALTKIAEIKGANMVACLPDSAMSAATMGNGHEVRIRQLLDRLAYFQVDSELKNGWLVIKPKRPDEARTYRADRAELGKLLRRLKTGGPLTLDEDAYFALNLPDRRINIMPQWLGHLLQRTQVNGSNYDLLRFYGCLTQAQKRSMANGGLELSSLTPGAQEFLARIVYGSDSRLRFTAPPSQAGNPDVVSQRNLFMRGFLRQATEALPNGIPPQGIAQLEAGSAFVVRSDKEDGSGPRGAMNPRDLAWQRFIQDRPDLFPGMDQPSQRLNLSALELASEARYTFTFTFSPTISLVSTLNGRATDESQRVTMDGLPDEFRKQYVAAYEEFKRSYANAKPGQFGTSRSTPPP